MNIKDDLPREQCEKCRHNIDVHIVHAIRKPNGKYKKYKPPRKLCIGCYKEESRKLFISLKYNRRD